jgi:hypothetical protein
MAQIWQDILNIIQGVKTGTWAAVAGGAVALLVAVASMFPSVVPAWLATLVSGLWAAIHGALGH